MTRESLSCPLPALPAVFPGQSLLLTSLGRLEVTLPPAVT